MIKWLLTMLLSVLAWVQECGIGRTMRLDAFMQQESRIDVPLNVNDQSFLC